MNKILKYKKIIIKTLEKNKNTYLSTLELKRLIETANIKTQDYEIKYSLCKEKIDYINTKKCLERQNSNESGKLEEIMQYT